MLGSGRLSQTNRMLAAVTAGLLITIAALLRILYPQVLDGVAYVSQSTLQLAWPNTQSASPVYTIHLTQESNRQTQKPVYQRLELAQTLEKLGEYTPKLIILDLDLRKEDPTSPALRSTVYDKLLSSTRSFYPNHDALLQSVIARHPVLLNRPLSDTEAGKPPLSTFINSAKSVGYQDASQYGEGAVRLTYPLQLGVKGQPSNSLAMEAYLYGTANAQTSSPLEETDLGFQLKRIPVSSDAEMLIYTGSQASQQIFKASDLLGVQVASELWPPKQGSSFVIGLDDRNSERHAQALQTLQTANFLSTPSWAQHAELAMLIGAGVVVVLFSATQGFWLSLLITVLAIAAINGFALHQFALKNLVLEPFLPTLVILLAFAVTNGIRHITFNSSRTKTKERFVGILSPKLMQKLLTRSDEIPLEGNQREITCLTTRIRRFNRYYEGLAPQDLASFSNTFQTAHLDEVHIHDGTLNLFATSGLSAYWNAPMDDPFHASHACRTAKEMQKQMTRFNLKDRFHFSQKYMKDHEVILDIGISTGQAALGETGTRRHFRYAPLGRCVDLAEELSRHCATAGHNLLICETTRGHMQELATLETVPVKIGHSQIRAFALLGDPSMAFSEDFLKLKNTHCNMAHALFEEADKKKALTLLDECKSLADEDYGTIYTAFEKYILSDLSLNEILKDAAQ